MRRRTRRRVAAAAGGVAGLVGVVVLAGTVALLLLGRLPDARERALVLPALVATVLAALAYGPARRLTGAAAERAVGGRRRSPQDVVAAFGDRVARGVPVDDVLLDVAEALHRTLGLRNVEIWTAEGTRLGRAVSVPEAPPVALDLDSGQLLALGRVSTAGDAWVDLWAPALAADRAPGRLRVVPARHGDSVLGVLVAERGADDDAFGDDDDRALGEIGRRMGELLRARQLDDALRRTLEDLRRANTELQASRARLVATADGERRRIERDLHDGAQQQLVALALNLGVVRDSLAADAPGAAATLDPLAGDVRHAVQQVRDLAHGVYPALLVDAGLAQALRAAAAQSPAGAAFEAGGAELGRGPAEVESAVYFCCLEALQNAGKHAVGSNVALTVGRGEGVLCFEVVDDGPGFNPAATRPGHGLQNMADRIGAVGGTVSLSSDVGRGTTVRGSVPWT